MKFEGDKNSTRFLERNIQNLGYAQFESNNAYDIPTMLRSEFDIEELKYTPLQGFNFAIGEKNPQDKAVHFFLHDYQFERVWNYPDRYIELLKRFAFVLSPDFSPYIDMPEVLKIYNVYRNRWCGRFWQENGIKVIPTVTWSDDKSLDYCLLGIPKHSIIAISTMGEGRWAKYKSLLSNWDYVIEKLEPSCVLLYGKDLREELSGCNIIYKQLTNSKVAI